jgi:hypothetical protein
MPCGIARPNSNEGSMPCGIARPNSYEGSMPCGIARPNSNERSVPCGIARPNSNEGSMPCDCFVRIKGFYLGYGNQPNLLHLEKNVYFTSAGLYLLKTSGVYNYLLII